MKDTRRVRQDGTAKKRILAALVALFFMVGIVWVVNARKGKGSEAASFEFAEVERGLVRQTVSADGLLQPLTTVVVKSYAGGSVDILAVEVGDEVKPGDLIAKIDPTDSLTAYEQARADLTAAEARLLQAREQGLAQPALTRASIAQAEANYEVAKKELERLQAASHPQTRAQVQTALDKAKANLDIAEKELARALELKERGFVSQSEVDTAVNRRDLAKAELESAQRRWETLEEELAADLAAAKARVQQAKASLDRAHADEVQDRLREAEVASARAQVERANASVNNARTMLDYTTVRAPRAGVILRKFVEQGTIITSGRSAIAQGTDIVELGDLSKMFAEVSLDESDVAKVRLEQPVEIQVEAFLEEKFRGVVTRIAPQAATEQNITTVSVDVEIDNPDARLKPGMTASCDFQVAAVENALYLPNRAVREGGGGHLVTILESNEEKDVLIAVGLVGDERIQVLEGLKEGDQVVLPSLLGRDARMRERMREMGARMGGAGGIVRSNDNRGRGGRGRR
ncbi:MAG: efflux RND transporter periplasmic adaptor subunit [Armatimonadetes bacterium]|nr:efflux RND transporter periplasmic adaptor subunit [Armatimonadota bacterium]NIM22976.1 efflux RND transporter periplasmic adaptor subunit [Armatimonadota bacterium]NIM66847.1 efflux RND transporter periplasmic adaptor subunit [Armatimonadota bacterium]NIM75387.1 efflux RND transporter periplasmic adaptor subunit [Armatimonadota bacterium]NIN05034.1 efflux RND transporter periplasmic adaptor subunit [Armatimonadota bacterium]